MGVQQISDSVIVLEDKLTFQTAFLTGILLTFVSLIVYMLFPIFNLSELSVWFGILFIAGDIFLVLSARKITITLDKGERFMTVEKFSVIGKKTFKIPFSRIKRIGLASGASGRKMGIPSFKVYLVDDKVLSYDYVLDEASDATVLSEIIGIPASEKDDPLQKKWVGFFGSSEQG
jgi:hypothetical protein